MVDVSLNALNTAQINAVKAINGPCLVIAGAGSGKTKVITHKIMHLIQHGFQAKQIAAITFTNKAALEMRERLAHLITDKKTLNQLTVCTFHSLGLQILKIEAEHLGLKPNFSIFGSDDMQHVLQDILATQDKTTIRFIANLISYFKNQLFSPQQAIDYVNDCAKKQTEQAELLLQAAQVYPIYLDTLKAYQAVDFDDLIRLPCLLLQQNTSLQLKWQNKLRYILIDEYQDTNLCQYTLVTLLVGNGQDKVPLFTAVGDDDQAIYAWRGANSDNLNKLSADFPTLQVIKLEQNYRSSNHILNAANSLIAYNTKLFEKKLWSDHGLGDEVSVYAMNDEEHEAEGIIFRISAHRFEYKTEWNDYAILYRSNYQARLFERILRRENMPYTLSGGQSFFEKAEIKDVCAYLRLIYNSNDDPAFIRAITTPKKGVGSTSLAKLGELAGKMKCSLFDACFLNMLEQTVSSQALHNLREFVEFINQLSDDAKTQPANILLDQMMQYIQYEPYLYEHYDEKMAANKWDSVNEFINWLKQKGTHINNIDAGDQAFDTQDGLSNMHTKNLFELTQMISLMSVLEGQNNKQSNAIQLSTLHAAKGLEFGHVYLIGAEEGILPFSNGEGKQSDIEEERRLMYVGVTRAKRSLHISWCKQRKKNGEKIRIEPSRFLKEMNVLSDESSKPKNVISPSMCLQMIKSLF
jgi:ATP-dependent DNA helicase Rep